LCCQRCPHPIDEADTQPELQRIMQLPLCDPQQTRCKGDDLNLRAQFKRLNNVHFSINQTQESNVRLLFDCSSWRCHECCSRCCNMTTADVAHELANDKLPSLSPF
jgi:hypothetical protein